MYQLNNNYDLGHGSTLINPQWELAPVVDDCKNMTVTINIYLFTDSSLNHHRQVGVMDYSSAGTWVDADLYNYILAQPGFEDSILIEA